MLKPKSERLDKAITTCVSHATWIKHRELSKQFMNVADRMRLAIERELEKIEREATANTQQ